MDITIVLPTFNERDNIAPLIERGLAALAGYEAEMVVVDDDSPDGTWQVVAALAERDPRVRLIHRTEERGLTSAIAAGLAAARGKWVGWMDCDLSMPPEDLPCLAAALAAGADIVAGSRYLPGGRDAGHAAVEKERRGRQRAVFDERSFPLDEELGYQMDARFGCCHKVSSFHIGSLMVQ